MMFPNGSTPSTWPRVIGYGGGVNAGQKSPGLSTAGHVRSARRPPEFVIAKSVMYVVRIASVTVFPIFDSHLRPSGVPHESARGTVTVELPITVLKIGPSCVFRSLISAWIAGSAVTPIVPRLVEVGRLVRRPA